MRASFAVGALLALLLAATPAQARLPSGLSTKVLYRDGHEQRLLMGGRWYLRMDPSGVRGRREHWASEPSRRGWRPIRIPHAWNRGDFSRASQRGTVGFYRKDFRPPRNGRWRIRFESVNYIADVFLDGRKVGRHEGGYMPFEVDTGHLRRGETHRLVIRVSNRRSQMRVATGSSGWWNYGGLLREVYLRPVRSIGISSFYVRPQLGGAGRPAMVTLRTTLKNFTRRGRRGVLELRVGRRVIRQRFAIRRSSTRVIRRRVRIANPRLWTPAQPELYTASARVKRGRTRLGGWSTHFGLYSWTRTRRGRILLNGKPIRLKGASLHEDHPQVGAALRPSDRGRDFWQLKHLGANLVRSHYPLHPRFLELADRHGLLVWDEAPVTWLSRRLLRRTDVRNLALGYFRSVVERDRNHASVLAWSMGNELGFPTQADGNQGTYIKKARDLVRRLDPSRFIAIDLEMSRYLRGKRYRFYDGLDLLGLNNYYGWYYGESRSAAVQSSVTDTIAAIHRRHPGRGLVVTEFGAEGSVAAGERRGGYQFQTRLLLDHLQAYQRMSYLNGAVVWILRDFACTPDYGGGNPFADPPYNQKGLLKFDGRLKPSYWHVRAFFHGWR